jgi:hypothetical protein
MESGCGAQKNIQNSINSTKLFEKLWTTEILNEFKTMYEVQQTN